MESLESLLDQALKHARKGHALQADMCACRIHQRCQASYGNLANWTPGRLIRLVHEGEIISDLGLFRELFYRRNGARKLVRFNGEPVNETPVTELVHGAWWLSPRIKPFHEHDETPEELIALQSRFDELMQEFSEELSGQTP